MYLSLLLVVTIAFSLIKQLIKYAPRMGLLDVPNTRSVHKVSTPLGAGIGIFIALFVALFFTESKFFSHYPLSLLAFVIVFLIGLLDDYRGASPRTKFIVIFIATTLCYMEGIGIHSLGPFFGFDLDLGWLALPFTLFAVSGFTNALNLIDGLDGLAGTISMIILAVMFYIGFENGDAFIMNVSALLFAAIAAFLFFNWNPAKIFLGDSGSLTIGFLISIVSIKALDYIHPTLILFLAQIPILDTLIVMVRRKRHGRSAFEADKTHLHHILLDFFNGNVKRTVTSLAMLQTAASLIGLFYLYNVEQTLVLLLFIINLVIIYIFSSSMLENQRRMTKLKANLRTLKKRQRGDTVCETDKK